MMILFKLHTLLNCANIFKYILIKVPMHRNFLINFLLANMKDR